MLLWIILIASGLVSGLIVRLALLAHGAGESGIALFVSLGFFPLVIFVVAAIGIVARWKKRRRRD